MNTPSYALTALRARIVRRAMPLLALASFVIAAGPLAFAQGESGSNNDLERGVKAAFLYKFLSYVEWPPAALPKLDSPYVIGVVGADTVASELIEIARGRTVNNRPVSVKRIANGESLAEIHMLFIGRSEIARQPQLLRTAQQHSIVTVTETEDALSQGSVINFRVADGRVRFDVSVVAAEKSDLKLSSRMLAVASSVQTAPRR